MNKDILKTISKEKLVGLAIIIIILIVFAFRAVPIKKEPKSFSNKEYGFELTYSYSKKEKKNEISFFGSTGAEILHVVYFPGVNIQSVIDTWKKGSEYRDNKIVSEGDVKLNTCTSREIALSSSQGAHSYYFISFGKSTVLFDARGSADDKTKEDTSEILGSLTCL
ncbi:MAG: hypothetical protein US74_C0058G0007 [Parcubacteria group bacterium GW2011_GWA2_38_13]|nr:MAG: hypothetical protein US74_C0058G0007 [Parcubacteria group bacterium GW2011_GWA2_38_13]